MLRRPPRPPLPPSAHDVLREARLLTALDGHAARTPAVLATCDDESVLGGVPFYVMEEMRGHGDHQRRARRRWTSPPSAGGSARSWWTRWSRSTPWTGARRGWRASASPAATWSASCAASTGCGSTTRRASWRWWPRSGGWLADNMPESPPSTIVHGDYRLGNTMVGDEAPARVKSVFDWELATIGDPLADVGYLTITWAQADDPEDTGFGALSAATRARGLSHPRRADRPLRGADRALGGGAALVPGAGHLEGRGVHGGQLQALTSRAASDDSTWRCSTRACRRWPSRPARSRRRAAVEGLCWSTSAAC